MTVLHQDFSVRFRYRVHGTRNVFAPDNDTLRDIIADCGAKPAIAFVIDQGVADGQMHLLDDIACYCHRSRLGRTPPMLMLPGGERVKNDMQHVYRVHAFVHRHRLCRHSLLVAIGGGAVLDAAGFAAATAHRGVRPLRMPTTVLAQCDAGIGVKNGVNRFGAKNFVGTFAPPFAVINDAGFLLTLEDRDWRAGLAEAVKVALLKDAEFFAFIERHATALAARDLAATEQVIARCAQLHLEHIAGADPFESGSSRPLDFGHWAAHWLEQRSGHRLRHGEAVAIGIAIDATYARLCGWLPARAWRRILGLLDALGFALHAPELSAAGDDGGGLAGALEAFREHLGGELTVTLIRDIGAPFDVHTMNIRSLVASIAHLTQFHTKEGLWPSRAALAR